MNDELDLIADLNAEDDDGLGWSTLARRRTGARADRARGHGPRRQPHGADRQVHFAILPGSVAKNRHLLGRTVA